MPLNQNASTLHPFSPGCIKQNASFQPKSFGISNNPQMCHSQPFWSNDCFEGQSTLREGQRLSQRLASLSWLNWWCGQPSPTRWNQETNSQFWYLVWPRVGPSFSPGTPDEGGGKPSAISRNFPVSELPPPPPRRQINALHAAVKIMEFAENSRRTYYNVT